MKYFLVCLSVWTNVHFTLGQSSFSIEYKPSLFIVTDRSDFQIVDPLLGPSSDPLVAKPQISLMGFTLNWLPNLFIDDFNLELGVGMASQPSSSQVRNGWCENYDVLSSRIRLTQIQCGLGFKYSLGNFSFGVVINYAVAQHYESEINYCSTLTFRNNIWISSGALSGNRFSFEPKLLYDFIDGKQQVSAILSSNLYFRRNNFRYFPVSIGVAYRIPYNS